MTDQEKRIAIAEACGWSQRTEGLMWHESTKRSAILQGSELEKVRRNMGLPMDNGVMLPDWFGDLNAMYAAEETLSNQLMVMYQSALSEITPKNPNVSCWDIIHAAAAQRADAFVKMLGQLKEL